MFTLLVSSNWLNQRTMVLSVLYFDLLYKKMTLYHNNRFKRGVPQQTLRFHSTLAMIAKKWLTTRIASFHEMASWHKMASCHEMASCYEMALDHGMPSVHANSEFKIIATTAVLQIHLDCIETACIFFLIFIFKITDTFFWHCRYNNYQ